MNAFRKEYILLLRRLTQNYARTRPIKVGDLCIVTTEASSYNKYPLGVVERVILGRYNFFYKVHLILNIIDIK